MFFYLGRGLPIEQSNAGSPIVITVPNHGASNGQTAIIGEHSQKAANGIWLIQNKSTHTFEIASSVGVEGGVGGICQFCENSTGSTLACEVRYSPDSKDTIVAPIVTFSDITVSKIRMFFAGEDTEDISVEKSVFDIFKITSGSPAIRVKGSIKWIPTVTKIIDG